MKNNTRWVLLVTILLLIIIGCVVISSKEPQIIVNLPQDAKPLEQLPTPIKRDTKVIEGDRAVLWWTVYYYSMEKGVDTAYARYNANSAVENVYGKVK